MLIVWLLFTSVTYCVSINIITFITLRFLVCMRHKIYKILSWIWLQSFLENEVMSPYIQFVCMFPGLKLAYHDRILKYGDVQSMKLNCGCIFSAIDSDCDATWCCKSCITRGFIQYGLEP